MEELRGARYNDQAQRVYKTIPKRYKDILLEMGAQCYEIRCQQRRTVSVHLPPVTHAQFLAYVHSSFPEFEADLRLISELEFVEAETGSTLDLLSMPTRQLGSTSIADVNSTYFLPSPPRSPCLDNSTI